MSNTKTETAALANIMPIRQSSIRQRSVTLATRPMSVPERHVAVHTMYDQYNHRTQSATFAPITNLYFKALASRGSIRIGIKPTTTAANCAARICRRRICPPLFSIAHVLSYNFLNIPPLLSGNRLLHNVHGPQDIYFLITSKSLRYAGAIFRVDATLACH